MSEQKNVFQKESLEGMSSPEKLNDYIKVSNPSVWIILIAITVMLITALIWGIIYEFPDGTRPIDFLIGG